MEDDEYISQIFELDIENFDKMCDDIKIILVKLNKDYFINDFFVSRTEGLLVNMQKR